MSHETIITCDLCKQRIIEENQTWNVEVYATCGHVPSPYEYDSSWLRLEICRLCFDRLGIAVRHKKPEELPASLPTIEDMIREIALNAVGELK